MIINILTNLYSTGLRRDSEILTSVLTGLGHTVRSFDLFLQYDQDKLSQIRGADINIYCETLHRGRYLDCARYNFLYVNPEWYLPEFDQYLSQINLVLTKTPHAQRIWTQRLGSARVVYTGFASMDRKADTSIARTGHFLHVIGKSSSKGSEEVARAWYDISMNYPKLNLTVITSSSSAYPQERVAARKLSDLFRDLPRVRCLHNIPEDQMTIEMNLCRCLLAPSLYEGYSHSIHEALSAEMVVITTDAEPMRSFAGIDERYLVQVARRCPRYMVEWNYASPEDIARKISNIAMTSERSLDIVGKRARIAWHKECDHFRAVWPALLDGWEERL